MSSHFLLTQYYRLIYDDLTIFYDSLIYYRKFKETGKSRSEFFEIILNVMDVESQNYEEVDSIRLGGLSDSTSDLDTTETDVQIDQKKLSYIAKDYLVNIFLKFFLDDLSQYPFWAAKVYLSFGAFFQTYSLQTKSSVSYDSYSELIKKNFSFLYNSFSSSGNIYHLLKSSVPFLIASFIYNFPQIVASTKKFVLLLISKIPRPPSLPNDLNLIADHKKSRQEKSSSGLFSNKSISNLTNYFAPTIDPTIPDLTYRDFQNTNKRVLHAMSSNSNFKKYHVDRQYSIGEFFKSFSINSISSIISHPFLVISSHMIVNPAFEKASWIYTYLSLLSTHGISIFYRGLKSRIFLNFFCFPFNGILKFIGLHDTVIYRRILANEAVIQTAAEAAHEGANLSVLKTQAQISTTVLSTILSSKGLLNYGILTLANIIPGFLSFVTMRISASFLFGKSIHRRQQQIRRKEIIHAFLLKKKKEGTITKKISFANLESEFLAH